MKCKICGNLSVKNGKGKTGIQRYFCKGCNQYWQSSYLYKACNRETDQIIVTLCKESCGIRSIARILKISITTVIKRVKQIASKIQRPFPILQGKEY